MMIGLLLLTTYQDGKESKMEAVGSVVTAIGVAIMIVMLKQFFFGNEKPHSERKRHIDEMCGIYKRLCDCNIEENMGKLELSFPRVYKESSPEDSLEEMLDAKSDQYFGRVPEEYLGDYPDYDFYDFAIEHLKHKEYEHIYEHWVNIHRLLDEFNNKTRFVEKLKNTIKEKMDARLSNFQHVSETRSSNYYYLGTVTQFLEGRFTEQECTLPPMELKTFHNKALIYPKFGHYPHVVMEAANETYFETYKNLLEEILNDSSLKEFHRDETNERKNIRTKLTHFHGKLRALVIELKAGKSLKGKCAAED